MWIYKASGGFSHWSTAPTAKGAQSCVHIFFRTCYPTRIQPVQLWNFKPSKLPPMSNFPVSHVIILWIMMHSCGSPPGHRQLLCEVFITRWSNCSLLLDRPWEQAWYRWHILWNPQPFHWHSCWEGCESLAVLLLAGWIFLILTSHMTSIVSIQSKATKQVVYLATVSMVKGAQGAWCVWHTAHGAQRLPWPVMRQRKCTVMAQRAQNYYI